MPTITLNKKVFEQLVGKKLPLEELKDRISMLGTDLEKIENEEITVEIFPNRPDLLSEQGFARAFSSFIGVKGKTGLRNYKVKKSGMRVIIDNSVQKVRPYTACAIVKNLKFDDEKIKEIIQIQEKLHITFGRNRKKVAIGVYPLEKITFPVYFKAAQPQNIVFQPLESERQMTALQILSQHKAGREYAHLLEGLDKFSYFIDAKSEILSLPPIINSHLTGKITEQTKEVFIECSGFDYQPLSLCLNMIVTALAEMGGEIYSLDLIYGKEKKISPDLAPQKMKLNLKYANQRLGLNLTEKEAKRLLERMGYGYEKSTVLIPAYRADILHPVDLVEDIAIAYGYENFEEEIPNVATIGEEEPLEKFASKIREILIGLGLLEVKNYSLITQSELNQKMLLQQKVISLKNALGDYNHLRNSLLPCLLKNLAENQHHEYPQNIFEIGRVFNFAPEEETGIGEREKLGIMLAHEKTDFTEIKQILDALLAALGLNYKITEVIYPSFIAGRIGEILVENKRIGLIGEIHPQVLSNCSLSMPAVGLELELEGLFALLQNLPLKKSTEEHQEKKPETSQNLPPNSQKNSSSSEFEKMNTKLLFYQDPYLKETKAVVKEINGQKIVLDQTIFFAFSGGQASDFGTINGILLEEVKKENHQIVHYLTKKPDFKVGDTVFLKLDWEQRYVLMKLHSAAHLVYYPLIEQLGKLKIIGSNINVDKARIDFLYDQPISEKIPEIEQAVNKIISQEVSIITEPDSKIKEKRWWKCQYWKMPCGGTHVKNTSEIGAIKLKRKNLGAGKERVEIYLS